MLSNYVVGYLNGNRRQEGLRVLHQLELHLVQQDTGDQTAVNAGSDIM